MTGPASDDHNATLTVVSSIKEIAREDWDACANPALPSKPSNSDQSASESIAREYNPFISYDFLSALEESGAATAETGWYPQHLVLSGSNDAPAGVMPCYLKSHSQGEYVFDYGWADAFERAGGQYYPKLQCSVPFTPVAGRRLLVRPDDKADQNRAVLAKGGAVLTQRHGVSSLHATFATEEDAAVFREADYLMRNDQQYHFFNGGYASFDEFLSALASRKRKAIRRERRDALANGITVEHLTGSDLTEAAWDAFFSFYMDTGSRKWGRPYLNRTFFSMIGERMGDQILLIMARRDGRYIAGALNLIGSHALFGRHWGAVEEHPFLHFEICYYQAMEWALAHNLARVEAGAQGEHKLARGYRPVTTYSAHYISNPSFRKAIEDYLNRERHQVARDKEALGAYLPFRQDDNKETGS